MSVKGEPVSQQRAPQRFDERWRLSRAGIVNVWHYLDNEFDLSGGRMILRGTNGSGKSRALEMLLPFLLDADRRRMDATGSARVSLDELMRTGAQGQANRTGYLWLELARPGGWLTVGALVRSSQSASSTKVWYFTTPLRVSGGGAGEGLELMSGAREPLSRDALTELIGAERITESPAVHRERVRTEVFGLGGDAGRDRYAGETSFGSEADARAVVARLRRRPGVKAVAFPRPDWPGQWVAVAAPVSRAMWVRHTGKKFPERRARA